MNEPFLQREPKYLSESIHLREPQFGNEPLVKREPKYWSESPLPREPRVMNEPCYLIETR